MSRPEPQIRQMSEPPHVTDQRHAQALADIQRMRSEYATMQGMLAAAESEIASLKHRNELLADDKEHYRQNAGVFQRKLIRLASAMSMMHKLSAEAEAIMRDSKDFEEEMNKAEQAKAQETNMGAEIVGLLKGQQKNPAGH